MRERETARETGRESERGREEASERERARERERGREIERAHAKERESARARATESEKDRVSWLSLQVCHSSALHTYILHECFVLFGFKPCLRVGQQPSTNFCRFYFIFIHRTRNKIL
jgi:hypothetical protein